MAIFTREAFLQAEDRPVQEIEIPQLGSSVLVREMDALTWSRLVKLIEGQDTIHTNAMVCAAYLVGEDGQRLFDMENDEDIQLLIGKTLQVLTAICAACRKLGRADEQAVEAFRENFPETPGGDLPSS